MVEQCWSVGLCEHGSRDSRSPSPHTNRTERSGCTARRPHSGSSPDTPYISSQRSDTTSEMNDTIILHINKGSQIILWNHSFWADRCWPQQVLLSNMSPRLPAGSLGGSCFSDTLRGNYFHPFNFQFTDAFIFTSVTVILYPENCQSVRS